METEIALDTIVLNQMASYSNGEFGNLLTVIYDKSLDRFGAINPDSENKAEDARNIAKKYAALHLATSSELTRHLVFDQKKEAELINIVSAYYACQAMMQLNRDRTSISLENKLVARKNPDFTKINFNRTDTAVVDLTLRSYSDYITGGPASSCLKAESNSFFYVFSKLLKDFALGEKYKNHRELLDGLVIKGPGFSVSGLKRDLPGKTTSSEFVNSDDQFKKDFEIVKLTNANRVYKNDIVGNKLGVSKLEKTVKKFMAYRIADKENPFLDGRKKRGFKQGFLFMGDTGTGKTMAAYYGMTLADTIARNYGRNLKIVRFNIDSTFQEGGVIAMKNQLNEICRGDKLYYIFIDEIDTIFTSRSDSSSNSQYHKQKLGLLMKFLDGEYPNLGNYIVVATVNDPRAVDRALKSARLERVYFPGPTTPEEKAKVLALNFGDDLENGLVTVKNWVKLGKIAYQANFSGRDLREIANSAYERVDVLTDNHYDKIYNSPNVGSARKIISVNCPRIADDILISEMTAYANKDAEEKKIKWR
jgi:AAA+ superfamily predicted ATPase